MNGLSWVTAADSAQGDSGMENAGQEMTSIFFGVRLEALNVWPRELL